MKVYLSERAEKKLLKLSVFLSENWSLKVRNDFINKLTIKMNQIAQHPESCPQSHEFKGLFKCVITKQTTFYYRINFVQKEIEVITIFDTRENPNHLAKDLK